MTALVVGTLLAVTAVVFVLLPLFADRKPAAPGASGTAMANGGVGTGGGGGALPASKAAADAADLLIARARKEREACRVCGPRPEHDALYCSGCGRYLPGACDRCGAAITAIGARFCPACGYGLA